MTTNDVIKVHHTPEFHCYLNSTSVPGNTLQSDMRELYLEAMRSGGHGSTDVVFNVGKEKVHAHKVCSPPTTTTNSIISDLMLTVIATWTHWACSLD